MTRRVLSFSQRRLLVAGAVVGAVWLADYLTELNARALGATMQLGGLSAYVVHYSTLSPLDLIAPVLLVGAAILLPYARLLVVGSAVYLGGALGNFTWSGAVPDWIYLPHLWHPLGAPWGPGWICNLADVALWAGMWLWIAGFPFALWGLVCHYRRQPDIYA